MVEKLYMKQDRLLIHAQEEIDNKMNKYKGKKVSELKVLLNISKPDNKASLFN